MRHVTLVKPTDEGRKRLKESMEVVRLMNELVASFDGKIEDIWVTTDRRGFALVSTEMGPATI